MTYHGTVEHGVIVLETGAAIPDGTRVEVIPLNQEHAESPTPSAAVAHAYGMWKDRTDLPADSAEAANELRRQAWRPNEKQDDDSR